MFKIIAKVVGVLAAVIVVLAVVVLAVLMSRSAGLDVIPGGRLSGEEMTGLVTDWSFIKQHPIVTLEVRPSDPYSVNTSCFLHDGVPYVRSSPRFPLMQVRRLFWGSGESYWAQILLRDPNMRLKVDNQIYTVRATRVEDPAMVREIYENQSRRNTGSTLTPEEIERIWFFRLESR